MLADFFCLPISFNSKKISAFEQRKDKSVKFTEKKAAVGSPNPHAEDAAFFARLR